MPVVITAVPFSNSASLVLRAFPFFLCFAAAFCVAFLSQEVSFFGCSGCCSLVSSAAEPDFPASLPGLLLESTQALIRADARALILGADLLAAFRLFVSPTGLFDSSALSWVSVDPCASAFELLSPLSFHPLLELCPPLPSPLHPCPYLHALSSRLPPASAAHPPLAPPLLSVQQLRKPLRRYSSWPPPIPPESSAGPRGTASLRSQLRRSYWPAPSPAPYALPRSMVAGKRSGVRCAVSLGYELMSSAPMFVIESHS